MFIRNRHWFLASILFLTLEGACQAASVPRFERQFLGIRLMSKGITVLRKFGSPSRVLVSNDAIILFLTQQLPDKDFLTVSVMGADSGATAATPGAVPGAPTGPFNPYAPNRMGPTAGPPGPVPGGSEYGSGEGAPGFAGDASMTTGRTVFWVYQYPKKGITNFFVLDEEGRVTAIGQAGGNRGSLTARRVGLGSTYSDVVRVYGFPELHERATAQGAVALDILHVSFEESHGARFYFLNRRLRGNTSFKGQGPWCVGVIVTAAG